jgi:hypothetical protein
MKSNIRFLLSFTECNPIFTVHKSPHSEQQMQCPALQVAFLNYFSAYGFNNRQNSIRIDTIVPYPRIMNINSLCFLLEKHPKELFILLNF